MFVVITVLALGLVPGRVAALTTTITAITFGLPVLIIATLWWNGWPFTALGRSAGGWARFAFLVISTLVLTAVGQLATGALDVAGIFGVAGSYGIFPYAFVLGAGVFVAALQLTFVTGRMPFTNLRPVAAGWAAIATAWILGLAQYFFLLNWDDGPGRPPAPPLSGYGPVYALDWPAILLSICVIQMVFFVLLKGDPFVRIRSAWLRFIVVNVFSIAGGLLLHWGLQLLGLNGNIISAVAAAVIAAVILIEILFSGWPFTGGTGAPAQIGRVALALTIAAVLYAMLVGLGSIGYPAAGAGVPPIELWVAGVCLNLIAAFSIVHVAVFDRWPLAGSEPETAGDEHRATRESSEVGS
ncbi:hypothetical protein [Leucobacter tenebrionis]|uniref:hypothetical protein n=1 Tax=Leucobacter tenebrionis TaxID=2873270 RepID=UPI001CA6D727|nr:hypothetical protein [Leucobacter tenebrionis]QZY50715.1 hypothetical protein KVY00_08660 [Leucobacter tenebrionis]